MIQGKAYQVLVFAACVLTISLASIADTYAQETSEEPADSTVWVESNWVVLPSLFYSPRTKIGGGGSVRYFPRRVAGSRPSSVQAAFVYTARKQLILSLIPDFFFDEGRRRVYASLSYLNFPDTFYGIGNDAPLSEAEAYTARTTSMLVSGESEVFSNFSLGLQSWLRHERIAEVEEGGFLDTTPLIGLEKGTAVGAGMFFRWDTRDNYFYTTRGTYVRGSWMLFDPTFGSDYRFSRSSMDIRQFTPIGWRHVIALRFYTQAVEGDTPFQLLPQIGGNSLLRGYREGRYKDNLFAVLQAEYRLFVWGPVGFAAFVAAGDVQPRVADLGSDPLIFSGGPGLRFLLNEDGFNFRIDYGIGRDGGAFYFTLGEAF